MEIFNLKSMGTVTNQRTTKMNATLTLVLTVLILVMPSCSEEVEYTGNVRVDFASESFDLFDGGGPRAVEGLRFGIFPTDFEDSFAFTDDAIAVSTVESRTCRFENILMGTYKVRFMEYPQFVKTIQVVPGETTGVIMLD